MRKNVILVDLENVQPKSFSELDKPEFHLLIFVGANQAKISLEMAASVQKLGSRAEYIRICGNGSNALDFHIAYYLGQMSLTESDAYFHVISKDTGFDPLIQFLKNKGIVVVRSTSVSDIPIIKNTGAKTLDDQVAIIISDLERRGSAKPRTIKTLTSTINALFQKAISDSDIAAILDGLKKRNIITLNGTKVSYPTSTSP